MSEMDDNSLQSPKKNRDLYFREDLASKMPLRLKAYEFVFWIAIVFLKYRYSSGTMMVPRFLSLLSI